jgi:succinate dehydrogenase / fumarate reductase cytochrome b subunit
MAVKDNRPFFLNLIKIRLPLPGVVSFLHRVSGVFMFIAIPFLVYLLDLSLRGQMGFQRAAQILSSPLVVIALLVLLWSLLHHLFAGIRFLFIDFDMGVDKQPARQSAWLVFGLEAICFIAIVLGIYL